MASARSRLKIERWGYTPFGAFGTLRLYRDGKNVFECFTLEPPELALSQHYYVAYLVGRQYQIRLMSPRRTVSFLQADMIDELGRNIALGTMLTMKFHKWALGGSREAVKQFMIAMAGERRVDLSFKRGKSVYKSEQGEPEAVAVSGGWRP